MLSDFMQHHQHTKSIFKAYCYLRRFCYRNILLVGMKQNQQTLFLITFFLRSLNYFLLRTGSLKLEIAQSKGGYRLYGKHINLSSEYSKYIDSISTI